MDVHPAIRHDPHPDHPGWWNWELADDTRFNAAIDNCGRDDESLARGSECCEESWLPREGAQCYPAHVEEHREMMLEAWHEHFDPGR